MPLANATALTAVTLRTSPSNGLPEGAPRMVRFSLQPSGSFSSVHADIAVRVAPRNDAPVAIGLKQSPAGSDPWALALPEGAPAEVLVVVAANCSTLPRQLGGSGATASPVLCFSDPDPLLGRAVTSAADARTDTYLGAASNVSAAASASDAGAALSQVSRYSLSATPTGASAGSSCKSLQLLPLGEALWDCTVLSAGSTSWQQAQTTAPPGDSSPLQPHAPFGLAPSLRTGLQRSPCWAQRHRLVLPSSAAAAATALPDDGCGTWSANASCGLDFEAAYCGRAASSNSPWTLQLTLSDTFTLDGNPATSSLASAPASTLSISVIDVPEAPVLAWADNITLAALALPPLAHPRQQSTKAAVVDDATGQAVNATAAVSYAPLLLCSQGADPPLQACSAIASSILAASLHPLPLEGAAALARAVPFNSTRALLSLKALSLPVLLNAASAPACSDALRAAAASPSAASVASAAAQWLSGVPNFYVQAFAIVGIDPSGLMSTPSRGFTLQVDAPSCGNAANSSSPLLVPVLLRRANRQIAWDTLQQPPPLLSLTEHALPGAATAGTLAVLDADAEQDVFFRVTGVRLVSCGGAAPTGNLSFTPPAGLFVPLPLPRTVNITDAATGRSAAVNATRALRLGVGLDALDLGDAVAACFPSPSAAAAVTSCDFEVSLLAQDSGDSTASHSLLPLQPPTHASAAFTLTVQRTAQSPGVSVVLGLPPAGLSTLGGSLLQLQGVGLMLPAGPLAQVYMRVYGSSNEIFASSTPCTLLQRLVAVLCAAPPGWGQGALRFNLLVGPFLRPLFPPMPLALSYAATATYFIAGTPSLSSQGTALTVQVQNAPVAVLNGNISGAFGVALRSRGVWGVPAATSVTCTLPASLAAPLAAPTLALQCQAPPEVGSAAALEWTWPLPVAGTAARVKSSTSTSTPARISFPPPVIASVLQDCSTPAACSRFVIQGTNLGRASSSPCAVQDAAACARAALYLQGLDFVQYQSSDAAAVAGCSAGGSAALLPASCALHTAVNCSYLLPHAAIACQLDAAGWGEGFRVRVVVQGQASNWSSDTIAYPAPALTAVAPVWVAGVAPGPAQLGAPSPNGGILLQLQGWGLSPLSQLVLSVGGVAVAPLGSGGAGGPGGHAVGAFASAASAAQLPPLTTSDGALAPPHEARFAPLHTVLFCAPPGVGRVEVTAWVGNRSATIFFSYGSPQITDWVDVDPLTVGGTGAVLSAQLVNAPACAVCLSNVHLGKASSMLSGICGSFNASAAGGSGSALLQPALSCPFFSALRPSNCALASDLWSWVRQAEWRAAQCGNRVWGNITTATGTLLRCLTQPTAASFLAPLFTIDLNMTDAYTFQTQRADIRNQQFEPSTGNVFYFSRAQDKVRFRAPLDKGVAVLSITANSGSGAVVASTALPFDKSLLLKKLPRIFEMTPAEPWPPAGGLSVNLRTLNAGAFGFILVFPAGMPLLAGSSDSRISYPLPLCFIDSLVARTESPAWMSGPLVCPITLNSANIISLERGRARWLLLRAARQFPASCQANFNISGFSVLELLDESGSNGASGAADRAILCLKDLARDSPGLLSRVALESCNSLSVLNQQGGGTIWIEKPAVPCTVSSWQDDSVTLLTPAWQGAASLSLAVNGVLSENALDIGFAPPTVTSFSSAVPNSSSLSAAGGTRLGILGRHFGRYRDLAQLWAAEGAGSQGFRVASLPAGLAASSVSLVYPGASSPYTRACTVQSWSDTEIWCTAPEGVPGSANLVVVAQNVSVASGWAPVLSAASNSIGAATASALVTYAPAELLRLEAQSLNTEGGYLVSLVGRNLARFEKGPAAELATASAPDCGLGLPLTQTPLWKASVRLSAALGRDGDALGAIQGGSADFDITPDRVLWHQDSRLNFTMPAFEGSVTATIQYISSQGTTLLSPALTVSAAPPNILTLQAIPTGGEPLAGGDYDPCAELSAYPSNSSACLVAAFAAVPWARQAVQQPASRPCFRANASSSGTKTSLRVLGVPGASNFGRGGWERSAVTVIRASAACGDASALLAACQPTSSQTVFKDSATLECALDRDVPFGAVDVCVSVAWHTLRLSDLGLHPQAVCACGSFHDNLTGAFCQACPPGGTCRGGADKARAIPGAWETIPAEWEAWYVPGVSLAAGFPRFVPCAYEQRCRGDNACSAGSPATFFMCSACLQDYVVAEDYTCTQCNAEDVARTRGALGGACALALALYALYSWKCRRAPAAKTREEEEEEAAAAAAAAALTAPLGSYVKIMLNYAQTLGALAIYTRSLLSVSERGKTLVPLAELMPWIIDKFEPLNSFGLNTLAVRCMLSIGTFYPQTLFTMALPVVPLLLCGVALLVGVGARLASAAAASQPAALRERLAQWREREAAELTSAARKVSWWLVFFTFLALPVSVQGLARMQDCTSEAEGRYLRQDPSIPCNEPTFLAYKQAALVLGWLYLALPVLLAALLADGSYAWTHEMTFLLEGYRKEEAAARAWECLVMVRKCFFVGVSSTFVPALTDPRTQLTATMFILALFVGMQERFKPLRVAHLNTLDGYALSSLLAFCFSLMIRQQGSSGVRSFFQRSDGSYTLGDSAASGVVVEVGAAALAKVPFTDSALFDALSALLAFRFIAAWAVMLVDDKLGRSAGRRCCTSAWEGAAGAVRGAWEALRGGSGGGKLGPSGASALGAPRRVNALEARLSDLKRTAGWRHCADPSGRSLFFPAPWSEEEDLEAPQWELPLAAATLSGWHKEINAVTQLPTASWQEAATGLTSGEAPPLDLYEERQVRALWERARWQVVVPMEEEGGEGGARRDGAPQWLDVLSGARAGELPAGEVSLCGWQCVRTPDGEPFYRHIDTFEACWGVPEEERAGALVELALVQAAEAEERAAVAAAAAEAAAAAAEAAAAQVAAAEAELAVAAAGAGAVLSARHLDLHRLPPPGWYCAAWDEAWQRPLLWAHVDKPVAFAHCGLVAAVALEPPSGAVLAGGWQWREGPLPQGCVAVEGEGGGGGGGGAAAAAAAAPQLRELPWRARMDRSFGFTLQARQQPPYNTYVRYEESAEAAAAAGADGEGLPPGLVAWVNVATGESSLLGLPEGGVEARSAAHLPLLRAPWEHCSATGQWRRQAPRGSSDASDASTVRCATAAGIPLGHCTLGGWLRIAHPLLPPPATAWVHLALARSLAAPPTPQHEAAALARSRERLAPLASPRTTAEGLWRWHQAAASSISSGGGGGGGQWVQEGSGAAALLLPEGAALPGGWRWCEAGGASPHCFSNALTGARAYAPPAEVCAAGAPSPANPPWRFSRCEGLWWQAGTGAWAGELGAGAALPGGWCCVATGTGEPPRVFVHAQRGEVRSSVPEELEAEP